MRLRFDADHKWAVKTFLCCIDSISRKDIFNLNMRFGVLVKAHSISEMRQSLAGQEAPLLADKLDSLNFLRVIFWRFISGLQKPYLKIGSLGFNSKTGFVSFYLTSTRNGSPIVLVKWRNQYLHPRRRGEGEFDLSSVHQAIDSLCNAVAAWEE